MTLKLTDLERRILGNLHQHGGKRHRAYVVADLAGPESRIARGISNGSNGAVPLIMGKWCSRLIKAGYAVSLTTPSFFYDSHAITPAGVEAMKRDR